MIKTLKNNYRIIREIYKNLSAMGGTETFCIGSNVLLEFLAHCSITDAYFNNSDLGVNWNVTVLKKN